MIDITSPSLYKTIILGEDDIDDQELLQEIFISIDNSISVILISNGRKILDFLNSLDKTSLPSLLILDYNMPDMNAAQILRELKTQPRMQEIPKIVWSTSDSEDYRMICLAAGANDYVVKPGNYKSLILAARHMLTFLAK